jgi:hypothetical protein
MVTLKLHVYLNQLNALLVQEYFYGQIYDFIFIDVFLIHEQILKNVLKAFL